MLAPCKGRSIFQWWAGRHGIYPKNSVAMPQEDVPATIDVSDAVSALRLAEVVPDAAQMVLVLNGGGGCEVWCYAARY